VIDLWPREQRFAPTPSFAAWAPWTRWVGANVAPDEAMLYLPMALTGRMSLFEEEARWMLLQTAHGRPMVNGFWGPVPREIARVASDVAHFPRPHSHRALLEHGVRWVVARPTWLGTLEPEQRFPGLWRLAYRNAELDVAVYEALREPAG
jgi:hypothetical protein